jgi:hypothetical protein
MPRNDRLIAIKQISYLLKVQPKRLSTKADPQFRAAILGLVEDDFVLGFRSLHHITFTRRLMSDSHILTSQFQAVSPLQLTRCS